MSFFRSDSEGTQAKTLEMGISVKSWGEAECNMEGLVFRKSWSPLVPSPHFQHLVLAAYAMTLGFPSPFVESPSGALHSWWNWTLSSTNVLMGSCDYLLPLPLR